MAHAIISGAIHSKTINPDLVGVVDPSQDRHSLFKNAFTDTIDALNWLRDQSPDAGTIILAIKPQMLDAAVAPIREEIDLLPYCPLVISILAGTRIKQIEHAFDNKARVIRVMPNTPAQVGHAMSAISQSNAATDSDMQLADQLFTSIGKAITIPEDLMDAFTALAGSGPAYLFYLAQSMTQAATQLGFDQHQTNTIVRQTIFGSASLLHNAPESPKELRNKVTSKNGTTYAATSLLDESGVMDTIVRAIHAARHRGAELGQQS